MSWKSMAIFKTFDTTRDFSTHSMCLIVPVYTSLFLISGPHDIWNAFFWILPLWLTVLIDTLSGSETRCASSESAGWPFDSLLYILSALQVINVILLLEMAVELQWNTKSEVITSLVNLYAVKVVCGTSSSFSGIVVAHELIHRRQWHMKCTGRFLLSLMLYEHFFTEHIKGHHRNFGTADDPATARFGESFESFWRRTVPGQFRQAWQLENKRLGCNGILNLKLVRHRVLQGVIFEVVLLSVITWFYGIVGIVAFLISTIAAVRKLEAVNYIEHWGLSREDRGLDATLSWDTDSWFTLHTLVGLSRHADHHNRASKPYQKLRCTKESPKLPCGYFGSVYLTMSRNKRFQQLAIDELKKRRLGPYQGFSVP